MLEKYPFILPIFFIWIVIFILIILVFYTSLGLKRVPILNRVFIKRFNSIVLFFVFVVLLGSGIGQLYGFTFTLAGKLSVYWHALAGYIFLLATINHLVYHIKDIYRYIFKSKPKQKTDV